MSDRLIDSTLELQLARSLRLDPRKVVKGSIMVDEIEAKVTWTEADNNGIRIPGYRELTPELANEFRYMLSEEKLKSEIHEAYNALIRFTTKYNSQVGKLAQNKLTEWRALMGLQLGDPWWEDGE